MAERKTLMTKRTASGAQQYTSERMKDDGPDGDKAQLLKLARKKADEIGGAKGEAFWSFVSAMSHADSAKDSDSKRIKTMYDTFEKRWAKRGRAYVRKAKKGGGGK